MGRFFIRTVFGAWDSTAQRESDTIWRNRGTAADTRMIYNALSDGAANASLIVADDGEEDEGYPVGIEWKLLNEDVGSAHVVSRGGSIDSALLLSGKNPKAEGEALGTFERWCGRPLHLELRRPALFVVNQSGCTRSATVLNSEDALGAAFFRLRHAEQPVSRLELRLRADLVRICDCRGVVFTVGGADYGRIHYSAVEVELTCEDQVACEVLLTGAHRSFSRDAQFVAVAFALAELFKLARYAVLDQHASEFGVSYLLRFA